MNKPNETFKGPSQRHSWWSRNWFYTALISIAIIGSFCAFCLPLLISEPFRPGDSVATLRQPFWQLLVVFSQCLPFGKTDARICKKKIKTTSIIPDKSKLNVAVVTPKQLNS